ncbi:hypothetical protein A3G62_03630 [Candidatus Kaiserbacteria bacterium RIFCSPLOWO2_12_FULL_50_10]|nr:MAG: hypothetical protein A3G62_03630 [Candidatus Kaiserbacteria bacterium RIFCSPLOWO2_12_FULL_50_10]
MKSDITIITGTDGKMLVDINMQIGNSCDTTAALALALLRAFGVACGAVETPPRIPESQQQDERLKGSQS